MGKTSPPAPRLLTTTEAAQLLGILTGESCSPRQLHYLIVAGGLGTDLRPRRRGETRLYGIIDLALMRLALRLHGDGVSTSVARVVLTYLRKDIILGWQSGAALALAVRGVRGSLEPQFRGRPQWATAWVPLREVWRDLDQEVRRIRDQRPDIWAWQSLPSGIAAGRLTS